MGEVVELTKDQADELLVDGEQVHTFVGGRGVLMGCDVDRASILNASEFQLAGPFMTGMGHGLAYKESDGQWRFAETKKQD